MRECFYKINEDVFLKKSQRDLRINLKNMKKQNIKAVGIDVSKDKLDICILLGDGKHKHLQISNDQTGIPSLVEKITSLQEKKEDIPIVIEATGGYHYLITFFLQEKGFERVCVINPLITKKYLKGSIRKTKTDKADALLLAKIVLTEEIRSFAETKEEIINKKKGRLLLFLKKQLQQVKNKLSSAESMAARDEFEIGVLKEMENDLKEKIKVVKKEILKSITINNIKIRGVSDLNLRVISSELGNIRRFKNHKQVVAFAGMDPSVKESGTSVKGRSRLSKRGSKTLRCFLFQSAWGVMMHNPEFKKYYDKKHSEGKHYYTCLSAVARKLLCKIYAEMKNKEQLHYTT